MVLIVDDISANIIALQKILDMHGIATDSALSGEEALIKILKRNYSLIIMDVQMPGMDGFEVVETLSGSSRTKDIPVIFLSALNKDKRYISKGYEAGGVDYITKPVDPDLLIMKVKTFLKLSEQKTELKNIRDVLSKEIEIRKEAQEKLATRMEELRSVLSSLPEIAFTISNDGHIEYVNDHWFEYSKYPEKFPDPHPDDYHYCAQWEQHLKQGREFSCEMRLMHLSTGRYRYFSLKIVPVKSNGAIHRWVGTFTDIQEQKLTTEMLESMVDQRTAELTGKNEELELRNHELQQFAWVVSHDLKEPIRKIELFVKILREKYLKDDEKAEDYVFRTIRSAERMSRLITDLLDYSRLSSNVDPELIDLNVVLQEVLTDFDYLIEQKHAYIANTPLPVIRCVPSQMRQVFQNLISNSLKFVREGVPPEIMISEERVAAKDTEAPADPEGAYTRITVTDNGIGFDERFLDKIFIIFQSLNDRNSYEGTGIGLAIAKKIIDKHNGLITARSTPGKGASFVIVLPLH